ncbi:uncharacterized protein B0P05DRAFT_631374 [Gilbertella persicaria]|uniref:uncharacterized protein n=1 Tax=Gilbertella persicaria TaxID=101096 RepID=UPI00221EA1DE|nr:uncharacterized protein B0P05DRAFT_631374 [Gilbertella persicaria]KAI8088057.1 hypothetical protein B0P05DRAFT_631374 [Gilbertella persicaria]
MATDPPSIKAVKGNHRLCFICTEPVSTYAVAQCDHRTCHRCSLRLRALYETRNCAYCKAEQKVVLFTRDAQKPFNQYVPNDTPFTAKKLNIRFETQDMYNEALHMMEYNCPHKECKETANDWTELKTHVRKAHHLNLCDLCCRHKKVFPSEQYLYTSAQLTQHHREGDKEFNKEDETGFSGHPECSFCNMRFYGLDELFIHCRDQHEQCFICVRQGKRHEYYANYANLEEHFKSDHYLCLYPPCLEKKFVVFESTIDLKAHEIEEHGESINGLQRSLQTQSRQLEVNFQYESFKDQRRKSKKREEPVPDLEEFPRIENVASSSQTPPPVARTVPGASTKKKGKGKALQKPAGFGSLSTPTEATTPTTTRPQEPVGPDTASSHAAVLSKIANLLQSKAKVQEFRVLTGDYRKDKLSAQDYVNQVFLLTNSHTENTSKILKSVEHLMDIEEKKWELVRVWRNKQTALSNFPALETKEIKKPPSSRVLVIKPKQTKNTVVGGKSKKNVWDKVATAASVATSTSPTVSPQPSRPSSPKAAPRATTLSLQPNNDFPHLKSNAFPSLPTAVPKHQMVLKMRNKSQTTNAWDNNSDTAESSSSSAIEEPTLDKKKKGRKNKVLFRVGL